MDARWNVTKRGFIRYTFLLLLILVALSFIAIFNHTQFQNISSFLRPLWETPPPPFQYIPHYYPENASINNLYNLHGWTVSSEPRNVFDAILFNNELDLLELRWRELYQCFRFSCQYFRFSCAVCGLFVVFLLGGFIMPKDMVDNLLTHVQILAPLSPCGHGGSPAVTPGHEAKLYVCSGGLVGARKLARKPSLGMKERTREVGIIVSTMNSFGSILLQSPSTLDIDQGICFPCIYLQDHIRVKRKEVVFVVDTSESMKENTFEVTKNVGISAISKLDEEDRFCIMTFNDETHLYSSILELANKESIGNAT
ncbi:unnamed protein product [Lactuca saligna]|uniref:VWFA domain-containing protein n=1 Tax=Lactuca saligna TaxID=75948 RepID=A0AA35VE07_LACSI|nr:unnamed protein product [Lactuca saligna]